MLQVVASLMIVILTTLKVTFMLLENIYITGVPHDDQIFCTGHRLVSLSARLRNNHGKEF